MPDPRSTPKPANRAFVWFERSLLGLGMSVIAAIIERRLLKAIKKGGVEAAPRTAAGMEGEAPAIGVSAAGGQELVELTTPAD